MGYFSNLSVEIVEQYESLVPLFPHPVRVSIVARRLNLTENDVYAVIEDWLWHDCKESPIESMS